MRQGRIKVGRKDTPPAAAPLLQLLPSASFSSAAASAKCALGTFLEYSFSLLVYVFLTCTKHLPSIFADTFYTQSTFSIRPPPLSLFCQFVQLLVVVSFALDVYLSVYVALLFPPLKHF